MTDVSPDAPVVAASVTPVSVARGYTLLWSLAGIALVLDQLSKAWIRANIPLGGEMPVWPGVSAPSGKPG